MRDVKLRVIYQDADTEDLPGENQMKGTLILFAGSTHLTVSNEDNLQNLDHEFCEVWEKEAECECCKAENDEIL